MQKILTFSEKKFNTVLLSKARIFRKIGIFSLVITVIAGMGRKFGIYIEKLTSQLFSNLLAGIILILISAWVFSFIYLYSEKNRGRESSITYSEDCIIYRMLKSRDSFNGFMCVYNIYYIKNIEKIIEKSNAFIIYGQFELKQEINNNYTKTKRVSKVKIVKYFDGLDKLISDIKLNL